MRQIVTNGLKYAPPGVWGPVRVVVRRAAAHGTAAAAGPSHISIEVLDAGPGLRGQSEEVLFADFASHVPATRTGAVGSSGLGLAICNRMARLLGGELHLHDRADGVSGTRFVLTLPVPDAAAAGAAALQNSPGSALVAARGQRGSSMGLSGCRRHPAVEWRVPVGAYRLPASSARFASSSSTMGAPPRMCPTASHRQLLPPGA